MGDETGLGIFPEDAHGPDIILLRGEVNSYLF